MRTPLISPRSEVFRAAILNDMVEATRGEIFDQELGEKTLATILDYVYTGVLELGEDSDIVELAWGGTKYLLSGFMELLGFRLQMMKELSGSLSSSSITKNSLRSLKRRKRQGFRL